MSQYLASSYAVQLRVINTGPPDRGKL